MRLCIQSFTIIEPTSTLLLFRYIIQRFLPTGVGLKVGGTVGSLRFDDLQTLQCGKGLVMVGIDASAHTGTLSSTN